MDSFGHFSDEKNVEKDEAGGFTALRLLRVERRNNNNNNARAFDDDDGLSF